MTHVCNADASAESYAFKGNAVPFNDGLLACGATGRIIKHLPAHPPRSDALSVLK